MAKGSLAKERVMNRIRELYGNDYVGTENNKVYVYEDDGGERVQIAISFVCPKEGLTRKVTAEEIKENKNPNVRHLNIDEKERQEVLDLMARLGL